MGAVSTAHTSHALRETQIPGWLPRWTRGHQTVARSRVRHCPVGSRECTTYQAVTAGPIAAVPSTLVKPALIMRRVNAFAALVLTRSIMTSPPTHVAARPSEFPHRVCSATVLQRGPQRVFVVLRSLITHASADWASLTQRHTHRRASHRLYTSSTIPGLRHVIKLTMRPIRCPHTLRIRYLHAPHAYATPNRYNAPQRMCTKYSITPVSYTHLTLPTILLV